LCFFSWPHFKTLPNYEPFHYNFGIVGKLTMRWCTMEQKWLNFEWFLSLKIIKTYKFNLFNQSMFFHHILLFSFRLLTPNTLSANNIWVQNWRSILTIKFVFWKIMSFKNLNRFFEKLYPLKPWRWSQLGQHHKGPLI